MSMKKSYKIEVECANCAMKMERAAADVEGVSSVTINFLLQKMVVEFAEGMNPTEVMPRVLRACRKIESDCSIDF